MKTNLANVNYQKAKLETKLAHVTHQKVKLETKLAIVTSPTKSWKQTLPT